MSQQTTPWILVSNIKKDTNPQDLQRITPQVSALVDQWQSKGRIMWSGVFNNEKSSLAVFEATEVEANEFLKKYKDVCSEILSFEMYQWDAKPLLSVLVK